MKIMRRKTRVIKIAGVNIGGKNPIAIQSMTKTDTSDIGKTIKQINGLEQAGCQIIRLAVKDKPDAKAIKEIKKRINVPIVADIHFDWRLALEAINSGADKIRLNPGNIYKSEQIREIATAAKLSRIPIRVGVNSGSVIKNKAQSIKNKTISNTMVKSALDYARILEKFEFYDIVISLKASNVLDTIEAYRKIAKICDYPLHLGVTATGLPQQGAIKSSIALGILLSEGIGDTIRVSLTDQPVNEVRTAKAILESLGIRSFGPQILSCPTCGRCEVDLFKIVKELDNGLRTMNYELWTRPPKVAVMGCVVNGPGEAKEADIGVAFGKREGLLFKNGRAIKKVSHSSCAGLLLKEMEKRHG
jgi:(E)-4-hydroxy-3-methylbut-2-enyl-diphosphate synthase